MSFEASAGRWFRPLNELIGDTVSRLGAGEECAVALSSSRRRLGLDPQSAESGIRRVQVVHLEGNVLDARLVSAEPLLSLLRIQDLDKLDLGSTASEEHGTQRVPFNAVPLRQPEHVAKGRSSAVEIVDDHPDVIDPLERHSITPPVAS